MNIIGVDQVKRQVMLELDESEWSAWGILEGGKSRAWLGEWFSVQFHKLLQRRDHVMKEDLNRKFNEADAATKAQVRAILEGR